MSPDVITKIVDLGKAAQSQHVGGRPPSPEETVKRLVDIAFDVSPELLEKVTLSRLVAPIAPADEEFVAGQVTADEAGLFEVAEVVPSTTKKAEKPKKKH